jgi:hypothetical protein
MLLFTGLEDRRAATSTMEPGLPKPVEELTDAELRAAWEDGNWLATQGGITREQERLLDDIERELARRNPAPSRD